MSEVVAVTACPACEHAAAPQVGREAGSFDVMVAGRRFFQPGYSVRACPACGLYFKSATLAGAELDAYYAVQDSAVFDYDGSFPTDRVLRDRLRALPAGSRVLDFGCSTGRILKEHTRRLKCVGVEPNPSAAAVARAAGIDIIPLARLESGKTDFDAVLLTDVFEHLIKPMPLLRLLASRLKPGGWLAIVSGNADAITTRARLAEFWYFRLPEHLIMLSERHLAWLAAQLGLRLLDVHRCSHYKTPLRARLRQRVQEFAYGQFQSSPRGVFAWLLERLPRISAARNWTSSPAINYRADHVVAIFVRPVTP